MPEEKVSGGNNENRNASSNSSLADDSGHGLRMREKDFAVATNGDERDYINVTPAADAGPRQCAAKLNGNPPPHCRLEEGHRGDHESLQPHGILSWAVALPVPQEAAPIKDACASCGKPFGTMIVKRGERRLHPICAGAEDEATAPDWAMRVAREIWDYDRGNKWHTDNPVQAWTTAVAALIRQAGSERYQYCDKHKWLNGNDDPAKCPQCLFMKWFDNHGNSHGEGCECDQCVNGGFFQDGNV